MKTMMLILAVLCLSTSAFANSDYPVSALKEGSQIRFNSDLFFEKGYYTTTTVDLGTTDYAFCRINGMGDTTIKSGKTFNFKRTNTENPFFLTLQLHAVDDDVTLYIQCHAFGNDNWPDVSISLFRKLLTPALELLADIGPACPDGIRVPLRLTNLSTPTQSTAGDLATISFTTIYGHSFKRTLKEDQIGDKVLLNLISNNPKSFYGWTEASKYQIDSPRYVKTTYFAYSIYARVLIPVLKMSCYEMGLKIKAGQIKDSEFMSFDIGEPTYEAIYSEEAEYITN